MRADLTLPLRPPRGRHRGAPLRADLRRISADGAAFSVMVGVGESYLPAFVLAAGASATTAALVASAPMAGGALIGLATPAIVRRLGSNRRFVCLSATVQALAFVPLVLAAWTGHVPAWLPFVSAGLYWAAGLATGPPWNTWIGTLVPPGIRASYFARRVRWVQGAVLVGLLLGGWLVDRELDGAPATRAFAAAFAIACLARLLSASLLARTSEPEPLPHGLRHVPLTDLVARLRSGQDGRFLAALVVTQFGVQIAGPYFVPFYLDHEGLSAGTYALLLSTSYLTKTLVSPALGRVARRIGAGRLLLIGAVGVVPVPALYLVPGGLPWLFALNVLGGLVWAAHELAAALLVFETIRAEERTSMLAAFNAANALAMVAGVAAGSLAFTLAGGGAAGYALLFGLSTVGRLAAVPLLRRPTELDVESVPELLPTRVLAMRPSAGSLERPLLPALDEAEEES